VGRDLQELVLDPARAPRSGLCSAAMSSMVCQWSKGHCERARRAGTEEGDAEPSEPKLCPDLIACYAERGRIS
jgi:hypothetical protein